MVESQPSEAGSSRPDQAAPRSPRRSGDPRVRGAGRPDARKGDHRKLIGRTVPRIHTPPLASGNPGPCGCGCALTEATTRGFSVVDFARDVCKVDLRPWQRWLLIHALETLDDGTFRFRNVVVLVARQNGKSTLSVVLALWSMFARGTPVVLSAAQDLDTAEEIWQAGVDLVEELDDDERPVRPDLFEIKDHVSLVNGKKALIFLTGERWKVKAANRKAARGLSGDLIILDELREQQNWYSWSAITKTTMARPLAQVWCFSNAGDITSVVLRHLRLMAHKKLDDPDGIVLAEAERIVADEAERLGAPDEFDLEQLHQDPDLADLELDDLEVDTDDLFLAEWSAAPDRSKWDREGWCQANPSLGYGDITEKAIASACGTDPEWEFRTEVLCQWPVGGMEGPFVPGSWDSTLNRTVETSFGPALAASDWIVGDVVACVAVSSDRSRAYVMVAGRRADGVAQVELHASRRGIEWVQGWLQSRQWRIRSVTGQTNGAQVSELMRELAEDPAFTIPVVPWQRQDLLAAHGAAFDAVRDKTVRHNPQMALDLAAASAAKKVVGDGWLVNLPASPVDAAPLQAWIGALWLLNRPPVEVLPPAAPAAVSAESEFMGAAGLTGDLATINF